MAEWNRTTPWRQGHLLSDEAAFALKIKDDKSPQSTVAVMVTHDCDLTADTTKEPKAEVILARIVDNGQGNFTFSKNARTLHLPYIKGEEKLWLELSATGKITIDKAGLTDFMPRTDFKLDLSGHHILQDWLAAPYKRSAFPDVFEDRLKESGLADKLTAILRPYGKYIRSLLFDVDGGEEVARTDPTDTYALRIYVLYATEQDPEKAGLAADEVREKIAAAFHKRLFDPQQKWTQIELCDCDVISDKAMTISDAAALKQWRLEHLSLREDPPEPMLET